MTTRSPAPAPVIVITGAMAAGKSTIAQALAASLPKAAHIRGDAFRRWIVSGQASMEPPLDGYSTEQLHLRHALAAQVADGYATAGITAVVQDILLGPDLARFLSLLGTPAVYAVVLTPSAQSLAERDAGRGKTGYGAWSAADFADAAASTDGGLHLNTSAWTVEQTVAHLHRNLHLARVT